MGETGTANAARGWCAALAREGAQVKLLVDNDLVHLPDPEGVEVVRLHHSGPSRFRMPTGGRDAIRGADVLVLHGGWNPVNIFVGRLADSVKVPYVVTAHGVYDPNILQGRRAQLKWLWRTIFEKSHLDRASCIHLFFDQDRAALSRLKVSTPSIAVPNGIDFPGHTWDGGSGGYILWLGRYDPHHKGLDLLLEAMATLPESERRPLRMHGFDWQGKKKRVEESVDELNLRDWVTVGDPVFGNAKLELLSRASGFVYPSRWEACPVSVAEALALGLPTLVGPYPLGEFVAARGGAFISDSTPEDIAAGLKKLSSDESSVVAGRGRVVAQQHFEWNAVARQWLDSIAPYAMQRSDDRIPASIPSPLGSNRSGP
ncbi:MAG: glycosyltransferase [Actinomycetota bacterium]